MRDDDAGEIPVTPNPQSLIPSYQSQVTSHFSVKMAIKKSHGAEHVELFILVGDNRIELVPQRTSFEGAKRRANDRESRMQEVK